jgi:HSP20 family molecular chaperone IbpA
MFNKIQCNKCGNKVNKGYSFCPECGNRVSHTDEKKEWGMIGKNDAPTEEFQNPMFGGIGGKMINQMLNSAVKMLEKEMQKDMVNRERKVETKTNFELYINGKRISPDKIKVTNRPIQKERQKNYFQNKFLSTEKIKEFSELPKIEPETNLRRVSNNIVYEISIPGVKSIENISIVKLEKSIEIKALAKDKAYSKVIPMSLNLLKYSLSKGKLVLELKE